MADSDIDPRSTSEIAVAAGGLTLLILITITGNVTVILAARTYKLKEQHSNMFIVNLALTDLSVAFLVMVFSLVTVALDMKQAEDGSITLGKSVCSIQCAMNYCLIVVSMMTLGFISIDRYVHIIYPLQYADLMTRCRIRVLIVWTWIQGLIIGFIPVCMDWIHYDYGEIVCAIDWTSQGADLYVIVACITCFLAPGLTMLICYSVILKEIRKSMSRVGQKKTKIRRGSSPKSTAGSAWHTRQKTSANQHKKIIQSLLVVVVIFFVCMTPFCVTKLIKVLDVSVTGWVNTLATFVQLIASATNPFIYGIFRKEFRNAFKAQYNKTVNRLQCGDQWDLNKGSSNANVTLTAYSRSSKGRKLSKAIPEYNQKIPQEVPQDNSIKAPLTFDPKQEVSKKMSDTTIQVTPDTDVQVTPDTIIQVTPDTGVQVTDMMKSTTLMRCAMTKNGRLCEDRKISPACSTPSILPETMDERLM